MIRDNDGKFGNKFALVAEGAGIDVVNIPPKSPNLNPICERFLGSTRREYLDHMIILGEDHLRGVLKEYVSYFNISRPHQVLPLHGSTVQSDEVDQQGIQQSIPGEADRKHSLNTSAKIVAGRSSAGFTRTIGGLRREERRRRRGWTAGVASTAADRAAA